MFFIMYMRNLFTTYFGRKGLFSCNMSIKIVNKCYWSIQINQLTRCNNFSSLLLEVYVQLNMFRASWRPLSGAQQLQWEPLLLPLDLYSSSSVRRGRVGFGRPDHDQQHGYHHAPTVYPEAATGDIELLMMGVRTPKTCWAVHKRQVINLRNFCI
jgi:hypothetical protein